MFAAIIYLLVFLFLIYRGWLFKDEQLSGKTLSLIFLGKSLAVPAFCLVYEKLYGGFEKFDSGVFYNDAKAISEFARTDLKEYLKLLFGLQDDSPGSYLYEHCLVHTYNWDNGKIRDFFYNDNRVVIRLHSVLHFIAFNSYYVHALFNCFLSFTGIFYLYRSFKTFFIGKETLLLLVLCFFPTLWFYTGAVSKEGLVLLVMGCSCWQVKLLTEKKPRLKNILWLGFLLFISLLLKPYLLCFSTLCFSLFFILQRSAVKHKLLLFFSAIVVFIFCLNLLALQVKHRSLVQAAFARQRIFADAAKGGIFLIDPVKFVRLEFDSTLVKKVNAQNNTYTIKKNVPYIYWEHSHQQDTLFCNANTDTLTIYKLVYQMPESGSNLEASGNPSLGSIVPALYYSLFYPFFMNAKGLLQLVASFENLLILLALFVFLYGLLRSKKEKLLPLVFVFFALALCLLVGITTPNSGAIFRYRSPAVIFILLAALYYLPVLNNLLKDPKIADPIEF